MPAKRISGSERRVAVKSAAPRKTTKRPRSAAAERTTARPTSVIMQARVDEGFARALVEHDAVVLGLDGPSALVREGLRLVHERAREAAMIAAYDEFYGGQAAPLPPGVAPATRG
jgi:hypothetical protein